MEHLAMNDVVVYRGGATSLVDLEISLNDRFAYGFRADGVIAATPTGSTAYALSAGGPIMAPFVNAFTIVPIAPHALTNRPIVVADDSVIRITVARAREALASIDGHHVIALAEGDSVVLKRAEATVRLWHPLGYDYYHTLREKLGWTETPEGLAPSRL
jgi:NAD+ kinase